MKKELTSSLALCLLLTACLEEEPSCEFPTIDRASAPWLEVDGVRGSARSTVVYYRDQECDGRPHLGLSHSNSDGSTALTGGVALRDDGALVAEGECSRLTVQSDGAFFHAEEGEVVGCMSGSRFVLDIDASFADPYFGHGAVQVQLEDSGRVPFEDCQALGVPDCFAIGGQ